ncbi:MAG: hypothetical protein WAW23_07355 [Candidatus Methanoperedens sp.]
MQLLRDKIVLVMKDLSWVEQALVMGGLIQRASENTRIERRSQFRIVHETAIQDMPNDKKMKSQLNLSFLGRRLCFFRGFLFRLIGHELVRLLTL